MTKRRAEILKKITTKIKKPVTLTYYSTYSKENKEFTLDCSSIQYIDSTKSEANITGSEIKELCVLIQQSKYIMSKSLMQVYSGFVDKMVDFSDDLDPFGIWDPDPLPRQILKGRKRSEGGRKISINS